MMDACVEVVGHRGFEEARILDICLLAHSSAATFYEIFGTKEECVDAVVASRAAQLLAPAKEAFDRTAGPWGVRVQAALHRVLVDLASDEPLARLLVIEFQQVGSAATERLAVLAEEAKRLFALPEPSAPPPAPSAESVVVGMVLYPIRDYVARGKTRELPELAPVLAYFLTLFLVGADEALELAWANGGPPDALRSNGLPPNGAQFR
jgi:AcrR family transcriptional regulator